MKTLIVNYKCYNTKGGAPKRKLEVIEVMDNYLNNKTYELDIVFNGKLNKDNVYLTCSKRNFNAGLETLRRHGDKVLTNMIYL